MQIVILGNAEVRRFRTNDIVTSFTRCDVKYKNRLRLVRREIILGRSFEEIREIFLIAGLLILTQIHIFDSTTEKVKTVRSVYFRNLKFRLNA